MKLGGNSAARVGTVVKKEAADARLKDVPKVRRFGSHRRRTRGTRKEWFVGRLYRRFTQAACGCVDCAAMGLGPPARDLKLANQSKDPRSLSFHERSAAPAPTKSSPKA